MIDDKQMIAIFNFIKANTDDLEVFEIGDLYLKKSDTENVSLFFVTFQAAANAWRSDGSEKTLAKIKVGRDISFISFAENYTELLNSLNIPFWQIKSDKSLRVNFDDFENLTNNIIKLLFENILINSYSIDSFGCCGRYKQCEELHKCVHSDKLYSQFCQMRKFTVR